MKNLLIVLTALLSIGLIGCNKYGVTKDALEIDGIYVGDLELVTENEIVTQQDSFGYIQDTEWIIETINQSNEIEVIRTDSMIQLLFSPIWENHILGESMEFRINDEGIYGYDYSLVDYGIIDYYTINFDFSNDDLQVILKKNYPSDWNNYVMGEKVDILFTGSK